MSTKKSEKDLSGEDQKLLSQILGIEKNNLHHPEIKAGSRIEKDIISDIMNAIEKAVESED